MLCVCAAVTCLGVAAFVVLCCCCGACVGAAFADAAGVALTLFVVHMCSLHAHSSGALAIAR